MVDLFPTLLGFMYGGFSRLDPHLFASMRPMGGLDVNPDEVAMVIPLLSAAEFFEVTPLVQAITTAMRPCVNCSTAPAILRHALRWGVRAPLDLAMEVLVEAFDHLTPAEVRQLPVELAVALFAHAAAVGTKGSARRAHMACDAIRDELQASRENAVAAGIIDYIGANRGHLSLAETRALMACLRDPDTVRTAGATVAAAAEASTAGRASERSGTRPPSPFAGAAVSARATSAADVSATPAHPRALTAFYAEWALSRGLPPLTPAVLATPAPPALLSRASQTSGQPHTQAPPQPSPFPVVVSVTSLPGARRFALLGAATAATTAASASATSSASNAGAGATDTLATAGNPPPAGAVPAPSDPTAAASAPRASAPLSPASEPLPPPDPSNPAVKTQTPLHPPLRRPPRKANPRPPPPSPLTSAHAPNTAVPLLSTVTAAAATVAGPQDEGASARPTGTALIPAPVDARDAMTHLPRSTALRQERPRQPQRGRLVPRGEPSVGRQRARPAEPPRGSGADGMRRPRRLHGGLRHSYDEGDGEESGCGARAVDALSPDEGEESSEKKDRRSRGKAAGGDEVEKEGKREEEEQENDTEMSEEDSGDREENVGGEVESGGDGDKTGRSSASGSRCSHDERAATARHIRSRAPTERRWPVSTLPDGERGRPSAVGPVCLGAAEASTSGACSGETAGAGYSQSSPPTLPPSHRSPPEWQLDAPPTLVRPLELAAAAPTPDSSREPPALARSGVPAQCASPPEQPTGAAPALAPAPAPTTRLPPPRPTLPPPRPTTRPPPLPLEMLAPRRAAPPPLPTPPTPPHPLEAQAWQGDAGEAGDSDARSSDRGSSVDDDWSARSGRAGLLGSSRTRGSPSLSSCDDDVDGGRRVSASEAVPRARGWAAGVARPGVDLWLWRERERAAEEADVVRSAEHLERELRAGAARGSEKSPLDDIAGQYVYHHDFDTNGLLYRLGCLLPLAQLLAAPGNNRSSVENQADARPAALALPAPLVTPPLAASPRALLRTPLSLTKHGRPSRLSPSPPRGTDDSAASVSPPPPQAVSPSPGESAPPLSPHARAYANPALGGYVRVTSSSRGAGLELHAVGRTPRLFATADQPDSWVSIELVCLAMHPTHYTLRHGWNNSGFALRNWVLQGSLDGTHWTTLRAHHNDTALRAAYATHTWSLPGVRGAYSHFRVTATGLNSSGFREVALSSFELYGTAYANAAGAIWRSAAACTPSISPSAATAASAAASGPISTTPRVSLSLAPLPATTSVLTALTDSVVQLPLQPRPTPVGTSLAAATASLPPKPTTTPAQLPPQSLPPLPACLTARDDPRAGPPVSDGALGNNTDTLQTATVSPPSAATAHATPVCRGPPAAAIPGVGASDLPTATSATAGPPADASPRTVSVPEDVSLAVTVATASTITAAAASSDAQSASSAVGANESSPSGVEGPSALVANAVRPSPLPLHSALPVASHRSLQLREAEAAFFGATDPRLLCLPVAAVAVNAAKGASVGAASGRSHTLPRDEPIPTVGQPTAPLSGISRASSPSAAPVLAETSAPPSPAPPPRLLFPQPLPPPTALSCSSAIAPASAPSSSPSTAEAAPPPSLPSFPLSAPPLQPSLSPSPTPLPSSAAATTATATVAPPSASAAPSASPPSFSPLPPTTAAGAPSSAPLASPPIAPAVAGPGQPPPRPLRPAPALPGAAAVNAQALEQAGALPPRQDHPLAVVPQALPTTSTSARVRAVFPSVRSPEQRRGAPGLAFQRFALDQHRRSLELSREESAKIALAAAAARIQEQRTPPPLPAPTPQQPLPKIDDSGGCGQNGEGEPSGEDEEKAIDDVPSTVDAQLHESGSAREIVHDSEADNDDSGLETGGEEEQPAHT